MGMLGWDGTGKGREDGENEKNRVSKRGELRDQDATDS